jgi:hypothetical protein
MDMPYDVPESDTTTYGQWTPWTQWAKWNLGLLGSSWARSCSRMVHEEIVIGHYKQTCNADCGAGYELDYDVHHNGGDCVLPENLGNEHSFGHMPIHRKSTQRVGEDRQIIDWKEVKWDFSPDPPGFYTVKQAIIDKDLHQKLAGGQPASGKRTRERIEALSLPPLVEGESLKLGKRNSQFTMTVDGREQSPGTSLVATKLGRGLHTVEIADEDEVLGRIRLQILLSVVAPIEIRVAPVSPITLDGERNGAVIEVELRNRSRSDRLVGLTVDETPAGWIGVPLGKPFAVIRAGKSRRVKVQVERMTYEQSDNLNAFSLQATLPGSRIPAITSAFYVTVNEPVASR